MRLKYTSVSEQDGYAAKVRLYRKSAIKRDVFAFVNKRANEYHELIRRKRAFAVFESARERMNFARKACYASTNDGADSL